jgi:hypothetical protein
MGDPAYPRPFPSLRWYTRWRMFEVLPYAGGLRDQDPEMISDWEVIYQIEAEFQKKNSGGEKE